MGLDLIEALLREGTQEILIPYEVSMSKAMAIKQWQEVRCGWYRVFNELAQAIAKVGGIGSKKPGLNQVRSALLQTSSALVFILKRTAPTFAAIEGKPAVISVEYTLGVGVYQSITIMEEILSDTEPDLLEASKVIARTLKQVQLALKYLK